MNRLLHKISSLALVLALAGCQSAEDPVVVPGGDEEPACSFSIYISTGDGVGSRAPSDGEYNPGAGFENYIDISGEDFRIAIYDKDNAWMANVESAVIVPFDDNFLSSKRYLLQCNLDRETADAINEKGSIKLVMMANWHHRYPTLGENSNLATLFDAATVMDYSGALPGPNLTRADKIAMFGVCQYDKIELQPNIVKELGTLHLLRALAKIEVWDAPETVQLMKSVSVTRHKTAAAPMPAGVTHQSQYVKGNWESDYVLTPSFPTAWGAFDNETTEPVAMTTDDKGHYIIYVPEFSNKTRTAAEQKARLKIEYEGRDPYYVDFLDNDGHYIDILRNYWYKFEVSKKVDDIVVTVQVVPYAEVSLKPGFGLEIDKDRYIPITVETKDAQGNVTEKVIYYDPKTGIYYDSDRETPIANPYPGLDPATGRGIFTDAEFNILYYYDYKAAKYYGPDNINQIADPYSNECYNVSTGITTVKTVTGRLYYYYRAYDCKYFAPTNIDKMVKAEIMTNENDVALNGKMKFTDPETDKVYYWDVLTSTYYSDENFTNRIDDPFKN